MYAFTTPTQKLDINLEDETDALNIAERLTDDEILSIDELLNGWRNEEQPELFI